MTRNIVDEKHHVLPWVNALMMLRNRQAQKLLSSLALPGWQAPLKDMPTAATQ